MSKQKPKARRKGYAKRGKLEMSAMRAGGTHLLEEHFKRFHDNRTTGLPLYRCEEILISGILTIPEIDPDVGQATRNTIQHAYRRWTKGLMDHQKTKFSWEKILDDAMLVEDIMGQYDSKGLNIKQARDMLTLVDDRFQRIPNPEFLALFEKWAAGKLWYQIKGTDDPDEQERRKQEAQIRSLKEKAQEADALRRRLEHVQRNGYAPAAAPARVPAGGVTKVVRRRVPLAKVPPQEMPAAGSVNIATLPAGPPEPYPQGTREEAIARAVALLREDGALCQQILEEIRARRPLIEHCLGLAGGVDGVRHL